MTSLGNDTITVQIESIGVEYSERKNKQVFLVIASQKEKKTHEIFLTPASSQMDAWMIVLSRPHVAKVFYVMPIAELLERLKSGLNALDAASRSELTG